MLTLIGLAGIILVVYPVLRPNVILIQQDLNLPNPLSTPIPKPTPTPLSPREQAIHDATEIGGNILFGLMGLTAVITMIVMLLSLARLMWTSSDFSSSGLLPRFPRRPKFKADKTPKVSRSVTYRSDDDKQ